MNNIEQKIFNALATGGGINLPNVGVLFVERQGAQVLSKGRISSPQNKILFKKGTNPAFASAGNIPGYFEWLSLAILSAGNFIEIGGVGVLRGGIFYPSVALHEILNPGINEPIKVRRRVSAGKKVLIVFLVVAAASLVLWGVVSVDLLTRHQISSGEDIVAYVEQQEASARGESTIEPAIASEVALEAEVQAEQVSEGANIDVEDVIQKQLEGYATVGAAIGDSYYLVVGVFSETANADKMIATDPLKIGGSNYTKTSFGAKTMVSAYSSEDRKSVEKRRKELSRFDDALWIYEKKAKR